MDLSGCGFNDHAHFLQAFLVGVFVDFILVVVVVEVLVVVIVVAVVVAGSAKNFNCLSAKNFGKSAQCILLTFPVTFGDQLRSCHEETPRSAHLLFLPLFVGQPQRIVTKCFAALSFQRLDLSRLS